MTAYGYTSGDPRKVDIAGDTMTGPLLLAEDPLVDAEAATKIYVDTHGGGGGGGTPSNTVVAERTLNNAVSAAGGASTFSRGDHTHGTPPMPSASDVGADAAGAAAAALSTALAAIPSSSGTVVSETAFGQAAAAGASSAWSRGDHTHGTPAAPVIPSASGTVTSETAFGQAAAAGAAATFSRGDHTHGTPTAPTIPSASSSVTDETSFGQASNAGAAATFSRGDHTHGTPAAPSVPSASGTVAAETSYGIASNAGAAGTFSRGDHTHGSPSLTANTPSAQTITASGAVGTGTAPAKDDHVHAGPGFGNVVTETSFGQASSNGSATTVARSDHTHGTPAAPGGSSFKTVVQARRTSGNINAVAGPTMTQIGSDIVIAAAAGDILAVDINAMCDNGGTDCQFEAATRNSGNTADVNYWSSGNGTSLNPGGVAAWYVFGGQFNGPRGTAYYTVQAGDVNTGQVRVRLYAFGAGGTRVVLSNASYPQAWAVSNVGS